MTRLCAANRHLIRIGSDPVNVNSDHAVQTQDYPSLVALNSASMAEEAMQRCDVLAECSESPGQITRRFLAPAMHQAHGHLGHWMNTIGMTTRVDHAGNIIGRRSGSSKQTLIIGSHLDTVPDAGRYDGVLGVAIGLAVVEALASQHLPFNIDVIGFSEEEGVRFGEPYLGSSATAGCFLPEWLDRVDSDGVTMRTAIDSFGGNSDCLDECAYLAEDVIGYIEPHLEQGRVLERTSQPVGIVSAIVGQSRFALQFTGEEGHAGTSPMLGRHDALVAAAEFVGLVRRLGSESSDMRATVGKLEVGSSAANVIPGRVDLTLDVRHPDDAERLSFVEKLLAGADSIALQEGCVFEILRRSDQSAVKMNDSLMTHLVSAADDLIGVTPTMASGAGHDAAVMAKRFPVAMLFIRHPEGISHSRKERVESADVATAIEVLTQTIHRLAASYETAE